MDALEVNSAGGRRPFVGRTRELEELRRGVAAAVAGRGGLISIVGDAGIGKTRLASEAETVAIAAGARIRWARCWEGGGAPAFWPWSVLVRALARDGDPAVLAAALRAGPAVVQLAPELRERVPDLVQPPAGSGLDSEHARFPFFEAVASFLRRLADDQPLVLVVDDLHAADRPSLLLLAFLARDLRDARVFFIGTYREVEAAHDGELARLLSVISRVGRDLPLGGWGEEEVASFVAGVGVVEPSAALVRELHRVTEGNPFFVDEMVRWLVANAGGRLPEHLALHIPGSIRGTVRERLRPLDAPVLRVLAAAAVAGRTFDLAEIRAVCGLDSATLIDGLGRAEAAGVVRRLPRVPGRYSFAHALIRETLYEDLSPGARAAWHRRLGEAIERLHAADLEPRLEQLAHHFAHAGGADGDLRKAVDYDIRAARRAAPQLAFEEAARHYERALHATPDPEMQLELRLGLGEMQAAAWPLVAARDTVRTAVEQARRLLRPDALARAALGFAGLGFGLPRGVVDPEIVALLEEALRLLGERRDALWARVAVRLAVELHFSAQVERRDALSALAVETARGIGDPATLAYTMNARHFAVWDTAELTQRLALVDEAIDVADRIGDLDLSLQGRTWRLLDLTETGDSVGFDREFESYERLSELRRLPKYLALAIALRGLRALWRGHFDQSVQQAEAGMALGERVGDPAAFMSIGAQIFFARRAQGRLAEIEPVARGLAEQYPAIPATRCLLALLYADLEREADARREYERLAGDDFAALEHRNVLHPLLTCLAEVCAFLGDRRRAEILYHHLLPYAGRLMGFGPNVLLGPASHALGTLADLLGQWDRAVHHFEDALAEATRMQGPAWLAAIEYDYARCLLGHGDTARAAALATAAVQRARDLGMLQLAARAGPLQAMAARGGRQHPARVVAGAIAVGAPAPAPAAAGSGTAGRVLRFPVKEGGRLAAGRSEPAREGVFRFDGGFWTVGYEGDQMRLRDTSGLRCLAHLLRHPGREFHAVDLAALEPTPGAAAPPEAEAGEREAAAPGRPGEPRADRTRATVTRAIRSALRRIEGSHAELGAYLGTTIKTGLYCSYTPDPRRPLQWTL